MGKKEEIIKLGIDIHKNTIPAQYSALNADEALRVAFKELMGYSRNDKIDAKVMRKHGAEVFEILEEVLDITVEEGLRDRLDGWVEYRNMALGDTNVFKIPAKNLYKVAVISEGNGNLRRQRVIDGQEFTVTASTYGVKIYEEFVRFLAGRIDWLEMVQGVADAFVRDLQNRVFDTLVNHFTEAGTDNEFRKTVSGAVPTEREILTMAKHMQARTGQTVTIYGTALALNQLELKEPSDDDLRRKNAQGYLGTIAGIPTKEIEPSHEPGTTNFEINDDFIILVPEGNDRMIKVVNEGESFIQEDKSGQSADQTIEYLVTNKFGISVMPTKVYGYIKFNA